MQSAWVWSSLPVRGLPSPQPKASRVRPAGPMPNVFCAHVASPSALTEIHKRNYRRILAPTLLPRRHKHQENPRRPVRHSQGQNWPWEKAYLKSLIKESLKLFTNLIYGWSRAEGDGVSLGTINIGLFLTLMCIQTITLQRRQKTARRQCGGKS